MLFAERLVLGAFDLDHLRAVHRHLSCEVYDRAGELRTVNITKGGTLFAIRSNRRRSSDVDLVT